MMPQPQGHGYGHWPAGGQHQLEVTARGGDGGPVARPAGGPSPSRLRRRVWAPPGPESRVSQPSAAAPAAPGQPEGRAGPAAA